MKTSERTVVFMAEGMVAVDGKPFTLECGRCGGVVARVVTELDKIVCYSDGTTSADSNYHWCDPEAPYNHLLKAC